MALEETQPRRGHLRGVSNPEGGKAGRDSFLKANKDKRGYDHAVSNPADTRKDTRPAPKETQGGIGTMEIAGGDGSGSVKTISDEGGTTSKSI